MSSPRQPQPVSSPALLHNGRRRQSRFTYKQLASLASGSAACPLRVVAHIDLDAFYAQCEMVRLGVPEDKPLAVQQWQGLIAINYPARKFGLSRHVTITDAQKACPDIILQHVATWREGDERWAYHADAFKNMATHKVSLDPYRLESRRILAVIKEALPAPPVQRVEKASIDEVFLDLSAQVHGVLMERYAAALRGPPPYDDPSECLPAPPTTALDWHADALVDLDAGQSEDDDPDWDDLTMLIGSEIVRGVRARIREALGYTCSAGLARNKMLAKLGSGHRKPNSQTVVRNRAIRQFLGDMKFTKIRNLGGKLGEEVAAAFHTESIAELLEVPLEQLKKKLGDDTGMWLHQTIRGEDYSEVNSRTQIKSMLSAKSFRPSINSMEQASKWLRIFVADIYSRLVEEGVLENRRRPKTVNLYHRQGDHARSRQAPIPQGKQIDEATLFRLAQDLMAQVVVDGRAWPCGNLSLSVGGFEDGITGNHGIGDFLVRGEDAKHLQPLLLLRQQQQQPPEEEADSDSKRPEKRRRAATPRISNFFSSKPPPPALDGPHESPRSVEESLQTPDPVDFDEVPSGQGVVGDDGARAAPPAQVQDTVGGFAGGEASSGVLADADAGADGDADDPRARTGLVQCERCNKMMLPDVREEHEDWHFARDLQDQEQAARSPPAAAPRRAPPSKKRGRPAASGGSGSGGSSSSKGGERGQRKLAFGKES